MKLKKQITSLSCQVQKAQSNGFVPSRGPSKRKSSSEYSDRHRRVLKKKRKEKWSGVYMECNTGVYTSCKLLSHVYTLLHYTCNDNTM